MDRTVPRLINDNINLYLRTYYSMLRSSREISITSLIEVHKRMHSALHISANRADFDIDAFVYAILRLPDCVDTATLFVMGQSERVFIQHGFSNIEDWVPVSAAARRRPCLFDDDQTVAVYIASRSDIDDLVPILTAYQIERQKLQQLLNKPEIIQLLNEVEQSQDDMSKENLSKLSSMADIPYAYLEKLFRIWGTRITQKLLRILHSRHEIKIRLLAGSMADYGRAIRHWWRNVETTIPYSNFSECPIYFISSNTHTLANLLSGYALAQEAVLMGLIEEHDLSDLHDAEDKISDEKKANQLYYLLKKYEQLFPKKIKERINYEQQQGIYRIFIKHTFDIEVQVIALNQLNPDMIDKRLHFSDIENLRDSNALIINIDYPLGMAASLVLEEIAHNFEDIRGVFSIGKAATLNGRVGDVMIPNVVHDEHSLNTYLFDNCFSADEVAPFLKYGSVMDNQKAITVLGTFLQNEDYMSVFYQEGYTDMEMEGGPYLSCIYEMVRPKRHPHNELVNLYNIPILVGLLHYASDTPFSKGTNLGSQSLSYHGVDATYAVMIATLRKIFAAEV